MSIVSRTLLRTTRGQFFPRYVCRECRQFSTTVNLWSGHNKWSTIKHDKGKNDAKKNKQRTILAKEIAHASSLFGPDPNTNPRLALAIANAKRASFPKAGIEAAVARGQGISINGNALENLTLEAIFPPSIALVIECQTDSKARALQDLRLVVKDHGGTVTPTTYLFEKKGRVIFEKNDSIDSDAIFDEAVEAGATDVTEDSEGRIIVFTEPNQTKVIGDSLVKAKGLQLATSEIIWDPNEDTKVDIQDEDTIKALEAFIDEVQEVAGVQEVYMNMA
ncbi:DUF28 domain protein [Xylona heveae TC161]|uniref:DUF28 domain protein n=1 Tax=Xylona heveae (strain CBS 132557 / TC161) TaxID=1328760 RepID=A0A165FTH7_XYLHT|nr:DUF28 domain protein [Xylona heveae TC161]KZF21358.1 DUF28 domain protein [Xylona heveae TC161]